jgi:hypothetical protein
MNAPCKYIADVANLVKEMPQYVHIMNLEFSPALSYLSIPKVKIKSTTTSHQEIKWVFLVPHTLAQIHFRV